MKDRIKMRAVSAVRGVSSIPYSKTRTWERWVLNVIVLFPHHRGSCDGSPDITMVAGVDKTYRVDYRCNYKGKILTWRW